MPRPPAAAGTPPPDSPTRPACPVLSYPPMRRLARRLFTLCSAVSAVLCVASGYLWFAGRAVPVVWNYEPSLGEPLSNEQAQARLDRYGTTGHEVRWRVRSAHGRLRVERDHGGDPALGGRPGRQWEKTNWGLASGESYWWTPKRSGTIYGSIRWWSVPWWPVTLACAA